MKLSPTAWIDWGSGSLFSPPFRSSCLLFRLYDINYSLLAHHEPTGSCTFTGVENNVFSFKAVGGGMAETLHVHHAPSARHSVDDLLKLPSVELSLTGTSAFQRSFGEVALNLEPVILATEEMHMVGGDGHDVVEQQIGDTPYSLKSPGQAFNLGNGLPGTFPCWKVSVTNASRREPYGFDKPRDWCLVCKRHV